MNINVNIQTRCEICDGEAIYLVCEAVDVIGKLHPHELPCGYCRWFF